MAEHAHSVRVDACTTQNRTPSHRQDVVLALFSPFLVLIALGGMARTETLGGHTPRPTQAPQVLAEGGR